MIISFGFTFLIDKFSGKALTETKGFTGYILLDEFYQQEEIIVTKKTKKSESTFDMKPFIYDCHAEEDGSISLTVDASSSGNIKPGLVIQAFYEKYGKSLNEIALMVTREETYTNIGDETKRNLVPLGAVGDDF